MLKTRIIFRVLYVLIISAIFVLFREQLGIDIYHSAIYSSVVILGIILVDLLVGGVKSYKIISAFIFSIVFLVIGFLLTKTVLVPHANEGVRLIFIFLCIYIGILIGYRNEKIIENVVSRIYLMAGKSKTMSSSSLKLLDTSTLIDGRIANIVDTGFIEGSLIIPVFVLKELQNIADSHDHLRRQKGRRGLSVMKRLQEQAAVSVEIDETNFDDIGTVDEKLITLAEKLGAIVITTDFNLMKVAEIRNIKSLNLNNLAIAMRQTILPGEELVINVAKEGKDPSQGVGYLDDGTMVVVEQGKRNIGEKVKVEVTSLLQTESGRIIFTRLK